MSSVSKIHSITTPDGLTWSIRHPNDPRRSSGNVDGYMRMRKMARAGHPDQALAEYKQANREIRAQNPLSKGD